MNTIEIHIARDFSPMPGGRDPTEGDNSGEEFLNRILLPKFKEAVEQNARLLVDFDDTQGYATSFLEAAFGGFARQFNDNDILKLLEFKSADEPFVIEEVMMYIRNARNK